MQQGRRQQRGRGLSAGTGTGIFHSPGTVPAAAAGPCGAWCLLERAAAAAHNTASLIPADLCDAWRLVGCVDVPAAAAAALQSSSWRCFSDASPSWPCSAPEVRKEKRC